jgi:hypothetical protein
VSKVNHQYKIRGVSKLALVPIQARFIQTMPKKYLNKKLSDNQFGRTFGGTFATHST